MAQGAQGLKNKVLAVSCDHPEGIRKTEQRDRGRKKEASRLPLDAFLERVYKLQ
jgi:hypothetical protein